MCLAASRLRRHPPSLSSVRCVHGVRAPAKGERLKQGVIMKVADARRGRAAQLILCVLATVSLAACGEVGTGGGQTLSTQGQSAGSVSVAAPSAPTLTGTPAT